MAITVVGFGNAQGSAANISVPWPSGHQADDIGVLVVETSGNNAYPSAPTNWNLLDQTLDVATTSGSRLSVFWRRATSSAESDANVADVGNHQLGRIFALRGCVTTGDPWNAYSQGSQTTASTSVVVGAVTTTVANTRYAAIISNPVDTASNVFSNPTNATLTFSDQEESSTTAGNGGGFLILLAPHPSTGSSGDTTISLSPSTTSAWFSIAFEPEPPVVTTLTADAGSFALSGQAATLSLVRRLSAESGSFAVAGQAASFLRVRPLSADAGSFTFTGQAASLQRALRVPATTGSFTLVGQAASLQRLRSVVADPGNYTASGNESKVSYRRRSLLIG